MLDFPGSGGRKYCGFVARLSAHAAESTKLENFAFVA
jgi:hypothetical protein